MTHILKIKITEDCPNKDIVIEYYKTIVNKLNYGKDCGVDLIFPQDIKFSCNKVTMCNLGICCEFIPDGGENSGPFDLVPRSSIVKTPLSLANSIGIFDPEYRGPVIAALRCHIDTSHQSTINDFCYYVKTGEKILQIISPDRKPIIVKLVDKLTETLRGSNGFGSTNDIKN